MLKSQVDVVTGAFGYSGRAIAGRLLEAGSAVRTLTGRPAPEGSAVTDVRPLSFSDRGALVGALEGASVLYNTYWVRFARGPIDHGRAVANSAALFDAARRAGVERVVHVSITHPGVDSPYPYFRGKALVEEALEASGVSYAILRPAILFGGDGVLVNNIAWLLRRMPVFAIGGGGHYRVRGIHVDDLASLAVEQGRLREDVVLDAVGPERPEFVELVDQIRQAVASRSRLISVPGWTVPVLSSLLSRVVHDVLLTKEEYDAMADGLADTDGPATGSTRLSEWLVSEGSTLGLRYASELARHYRSPRPARNRATIGLGSGGCQAL